jgi:hypothetical protein
VQQTGTYTVSALVSTADEQSLRNAGTSYPEWVSKHYLQLPETVTPRTRARAREIVEQASASNPYDQAKAIQDALRSLIYDESRPAPPPDRDWVDYFLFSGQRGYCDDFATSMVVLLRSLNVPARLAQGYAGGALDPQLNAYVVRESIGHSWPEVYFPGYGWQRFEPTPASYASVPVRPALPSADGSDSSGPSGAGGLGDLSAEERMRQRLLEQELLDQQQGAPGNLEAIRQAQQERLARERARQLVIIGGIVAALLAGVAMFFLSLRRELRGLSPATAAYVRLARLAAWAGLPQAEHVTPYEYGGEIGRNLPEQRQAVDRIVGAYVAERYSPEEQTRAGAELEGDFLTLRKPLLARMVSRIGVSAESRRREARPQAKNGKRR